MKFEIEKTEAELTEALKHGMKKIIVNRLSEVEWKSKAMTNKLNDMIEQYVPKLVKTCVNDIDITAMVEKRVEQKATAMIQKMARGDR
jgi:hypothetical protein